MRFINISKAPTYSSASPTKNASVSTHPTPQKETSLSTIKALTPKAETPLSARNSARLFVAAIGTHIPNTTNNKMRPKAPAGGLFAPVKRELAEPSDTLAEGERDALLPSSAALN